MTYLYYRSYQLAHPFSSVNSVYELSALVVSLYAYVSVLIILFINLFSFITEVQMKDIVIHEKYNKSLIKLNSFKHMHCAEQERVDSL